MIESTAKPADLTVILPAHNPDARRLRATLEGLSRQTLPADRWTTVVIDNASTSFPPEADLAAAAPAGCRIRREPRLGLSAARRHGLLAAKSGLVVFVDDDNVLAPDYLANVVALFAAHPTVGLAGGKSLPRFDVEPPAWMHEFFSLLALRDLGERAIISHRPHSADIAGNAYPLFAPIGAGMAGRSEALRPWLEDASPISDRRGKHLFSSGDNDIVLSALRAGWEVGYFPQLQLTHLIPASRLDPQYLARLNRGIQTSWMRVLRRHDANPWPPLGRTSAALRKLKAWFSYRAWRSPAARIRWQGACGHFDGRVNTG
ncbi:MAG TPA: glycosyltransferase [Opitutus sp.]|nr:glycosyltransferase [Opitutus sp.]